MTNVQYQDQIRSMIQYKQSQSKGNQESIIVSLEELDKPVSSNEIKQHLDQKALQKAQSEADLKHSNAEITDSEIQEYINKNGKSMNLRTVQRWLTGLVKQGFVDKKNNKYSLSVTGKREIQFREFAQGYGGDGSEIYDGLSFSDYKYTREKPKEVSGNIWNLCRLLSNRSWTTHNS